MIKKILSLLPAILLFSMLQAQQVGSFQETITFAESDYNFTRTLYYHVPTDYDASNNYKLVVGFRGGPHSNAGQFRDQLIFLADSLDAIIVCPENENHFNNQEGLTKQLFKYSVDTTSSRYSIDSDFIYLTGLSYGGRHAVIVSMDTDNGPIPNLRGVIPFAAGSNSHLEPDYGDISDFPPACMCIGLNDSANFINVSNSLHNDIQTNGGESFLNEISGVGHTVAFASYPAEFMECVNFIESTYSTSSITESKIDLVSKINISPNPAGQYITISIDDELSPNKIYVVDISGKLVLNIDPKQRKVDLSSLNNGMMSLVLVFNNEVVTKKFLVAE